MYPESKSSDSSREISKIQHYKCQVRGSFCQISEEYDVKDYNVVAEAEATCIWKVSHQIAVERFLKVCIISVK